jgi:hypothetical protein
MDGKLELIIGIPILILVIALTRRYHAWQIRRAQRRVVDDLKEQGALSPEAAVELPYVRRPMMGMGLRDHRKMALQQLTMEEIVGMTPEGRFYLMRKDL